MKEYSGNLDEMLNAYFVHFGENYPLTISNTMNDEEIIEDIERRLQRGVKVREICYNAESDY